MLDASSSFTRSISSVLNNFGHCLYDVWSELFPTYRTYFYGSPLWNIADKNASRFYTARLKAVRKMFNLPNMTHNELLSKVTISCFSSQNMSLRFLSNLISHGSGSSVAKSYNFLLFKCGITHNVLQYDSLPTIIKRIGQ